ncbi:MAG: FAD-dependent monooxygenase [Rhodocyclaceae bacterium]|nr:FAD-dependent monooxygenase [Rhodocyclaceae bacterium]MCA3076277.1 FAD-dependent monooxygenase [Rhodocyclaceae bacterium]MCA3091023.1 FAD-dependent monooxygenase [Rhodocyclaceae bacterium]MCA3095235.1 FAD-dependent monooxygenase [Rhodocyclaceae bacterium]MCA3101749.1 FAD-dependent monooxygenase [Rhodocyclaceae bacterium]
MAATSERHVLISGGGPTGVVAALACAQRGFRVTLIEAASEIDDNPRAATTHPSTLEYIDRLGFVDEFIDKGLVCRYFQFWDRDTQTRVAQFDHEILRDETKFPFAVQTEQHKLVQMLLPKIRAFPGCSAELGTEVVDAVQDEHKVTVTVRRDGELSRIDCDWLVAADGGRSTIRKQLDIPFEGFTFPERFTVLTTVHDFERSLGCCYRNYLAGSEEWAMIFKVAGDDMKGRWRAVMPTRESETDAQALADESVLGRIQGLDRSCTLDDVVHRKIYNVHQRIAAKFRVGRIYLAGDASHLNNPIGGLGLNCGIHDAMELVDTLEAARAGAGEERLDRYQRRRRTLNAEFIQEQTINNKKRLEEKDPAARQRRLDELRATEADPVKHKAFLMRSSLIASVRRAGTID